MLSYVGRILARTRSSASFANARHQTEKVGAVRGEARRDDGAKAKHHSPARKRSISGSGDDEA